MDEYEGCKCATVDSVSLKASTTSHHHIIIQSHPVSHYATARIKISIIINQMIVEESTDEIIRNLSARACQTSTLTRHTRRPLRPLQDLTTHISYFGNAP
jgi:hypothetical protein